ncbi:nitrogen-specific signal transduction histidine kinase [Methanomicrobium sp. W14]|uniref:sensor histidine kinase n=1 Tax=Methanomicrobium sp. W14 TaxID=2817839 RepID=UPI001AEB2D0F|nr:HAMP domain-containing sensor histidine kinase [Methanomicrobium sp. W14]MBP2133599.1 nitrogen-specific signal transduction histidine kinase [Methanomicrobium sp. W14]
MVIDKYKEKIQEITQNTAGIFGCEYSEIAGKRLNDIMFLDSRVINVIRKLFLANGEIKNFHAKTNPDSGKCRDILISGKNIPSSDMAVFAVSDVTGKDTSGIYSKDYTKTIPGNLYHLPGSLYFIYDSDGEITEYHVPECITPENHDNCFFKKDNDKYGKKSPAAGREYFIEEGIKNSGDLNTGIKAGKMNSGKYIHIISPIPDDFLPECKESGACTKGPEEKSSDEDEVSRWTHFIDIISHELRTPLQPALGYLQLLIDDMEKNGNNNMDMNFLKKSLACVKRESYIVEKMLQISSLVSCEVLLNFSDINLYELVSDVTRAGDYCEKAVIVYDIPKNTYICGDFDKIYQIMDSLISNAAAYSNKFGRIEISYRGDARNHYVSVSDKGRGIEKDCLEKIFNPFFICNYMNNSREYSRLGLGLSIARRYARSHGGDIKAESKINEGSIFTFFLPKDLSSKEYSNTRAPETSKKIFKDTSVKRAC